MPTPSLRESDRLQRGPSHRWVVVAYYILRAFYRTDRESRRSGNAHAISSNADDLGRHDPRRCAEIGEYTLLVSGRIFPVVVYLSARARLAQSHVRRKSHNTRKACAN
jgi:hypothetical protein